MTREHCCVSVISWPLQEDIRVYQTTTNALNPTGGTFPVVHSVGQYTAWLLLASSIQEVASEDPTLGGLCLNKASAVYESLCHWSPLLPRQQVCLLQAVTGFPLFQMKNKRERGRNRDYVREGGELTFITRVPWLSLRGLNNQYVKLSGCALAPTTRLQTPGRFLIKQKRWEAVASAKSPG